MADLGRPPPEPPQPGIGEMLPGTMPHRFPVFASASPHTGSLPGRRRPRPVAIAWHRGDPPFHEQHPSPTRPIRQGPRRLAAPGRRPADLPAQFRRRQRGRPRRPSGLSLRVDNLAALGVDAIRLSPFHPSALADGGYDVDGHRNVDERLGTLEDLDAMVAAAHREDIKVIVDVVPNHGSNRHKWFTAARAAEPGSPERPPPLPGRARRARGTIALGPAFARRRSGLHPSRRSSRAGRRSAGPVAPAPLCLRTTRR